MVCALFDFELFWEESLSGDGCARGLLAQHKRHFFVFLIEESFFNRTKDEFPY